MKIVRYRTQDAVSYGVLRGNSIEPILGEPWPSIVPSGAASVPLNQVKLLAPVRPGKILAVGFNYRDHAREFNKPIPTVPNIFMKPDTSLTAPDAPVILPPLYTRQVEHEAELVVVIGKKARFVPEKEALDYVLGYTCGNDVTARDMQSPTNQWSVCKGFDTFAPIGPWIETDLDASHLDIVMRVNGEIRQTTNTKELIFSVPYLISYLSGCMTLNPGDILFTGTTSGVSPVHDGDVMEVDIQSIGVLRNPVKRFEKGE